MWKGFEMVSNEIHCWFFPVAKDGDSDDVDGDGYGDWNVDDDDDDVDDVLAGGKWLSG